MQTPKSQARVLDIGSANEEAAFVKELNALRSIFPPRSLTNQPFKKVLFDLYQLQIADQNPFVLALNHQCWLKSYFRQFLDQGLALPTMERAKFVFLQLAAQPLTIEYLERILELSFLDRLTVDRLQLFAKAHTMNKERAIDFAWSATDNMPTFIWNLGIDLLLAIPAEEARPGVGEQMLYFVNNVLPLFVERFADRMDTSCLYRQKKRMVDWFLAWELHELRAIEGVAEEDPYYDISFAQIVKYIPEYILWNNGMRYARQDKVYTFNSPEFRHLALGGSIRKGPDPRVYTRRMARTLLELPYCFPYPDFDLYLYAFCESLGVEGLLHEWLQAYINYPEDLASAQKTLELWNPIIQKLSQLKLQNEPAQVAQQILGYIYHCLRDQEGFSLQGRSLDWLRRVSIDYYENIRRRAAERAERDRMNRELWDEHRRKYWSWKPHNTVKPYTWQSKEEDGKYRIIELCTKKELEKEGVIMNHCVGSYAPTCRSSDVSIWSLQEYKKEKWYSLVTIELGGEVIRQARGRFNRSPNQDELDIISKWMKKEDLEWAIWY